MSDPKNTDSRKVGLTLTRQISAASSKLPNSSAAAPDCTLNGNTKTGAAKEKIAGAAERQNSGSSGQNIKPAFKIKKLPQSRCVAINEASNKGQNQRVAEHFAALGLHVFPCGPDKKPLVKWRDESTVDRNVIAKWWSANPDALPAIDVAKSGLIVIDADRHGGHDGVAALERLAHLRELCTPVVSTPRDGLHVYFKQPKGTPFGNGRGRLPPGIDVRGCGGYVIAPGTILPDGRKYRWHKNTPPLAKAIRTNAIPVLPQEIERLLREPQATANNAAREQPPKITGPNRESAYADAALENLAIELASAKPGERNEKLNCCAFRLGTMLALGWISRAKIVDALTEACRLNGLGNNDGSNSVRATLTSGLEAGLKEPHPALEQQLSSSGIRRLDARHPASQSGLDTICAADVQPRNVEFIWLARLARGKHTCVAGEGGLGKSQLCCSTAAIVSTGGLWPANEGRAPVGNIIILSAEDGLNDVLIPRLMAAGADLKRIHIVTATSSNDGKGTRRFDLRTDIARLEAKIREIGDVAVVFIDPISSYMGELDSHNNTKLRAVLDPISELAERTNVAFVSVTHFTKAGAATGIKAMHRVMGGAAFTTAPRAAFAVVQDPDDPNRRMLLHLKNNLAPKPQGLAFTVEQRVVATDATGKDIAASCVVWDSEPVSITADEAMSHPRDATAKEDAIEFLRSVLAAGPIKVGEIEQQARDAGLLSEDQRLSQSKPFRSARNALGIQPYQQKGERAGGWVWALPGLDATSRPPL